MNGGVQEPHFHGSGTQMTGMIVWETERPPQPLLPAVGGTKSGWGISVVMLLDTGLALPALSHRLPKIIFGPKSSSRRLKYFWWLRARVFRGESPLVEVGRVAKTRVRGQAGRKRQQHNEWEDSWARGTKGMSSNMS